MAPPKSSPAAAEPQPPTLPNCFTLVYLDAIIQMLNEQTNQAQTTAQALIDNISLPDHERAGAQRVLDKLNQPPLARMKLALNLVTDITARSPRSYSPQNAILLTRLSGLTGQVCKRVGEMLDELRGEGETRGLEEVLGMLSLTTEGSCNGAEH